ncbi:flagellar biosynthesis anti-sigma factor FlgM [Novosphingobium sp.]|uniref:flagellar biosynthesis anti-sigma factor FlgM n=1 Tax=Novosphingobium sp. TaxID=1874826 RepID=UPI00286B7CCE|nr:flagellar biosynthesis anti-sigma factor FlgM [Novosphingobium sp.]
MPPIEIGSGGPHAPRAIGPVDAKPIQGRAVANDTARSRASPQSAVVRSAALDPGAPPVDLERIAKIRKAIEDNRYPVLPMKVSDAIIAAGFLLRSGK